VTSKHKHDMSRTNAVLWIFTVRTKKIKDL